MGWMVGSTKMPIASLIYLLCLHVMRSVDRISSDMVHAMHKAMPSNRRTCRVRMTFLKVS